MTNHIIYISLGILPSLIWLLFFLKKDPNPEPQKKILEIFLSGGLSALLAAIIEIFALEKLFSPDTTILFEEICLFLAIAFIEETLKYSVVLFRVFGEPELDEPLDIIIYMITAALGFAALENIFLFFSEKLHLIEVFLVSGFRLLSATFLHALCSGILGYFIALSFLRKKKKNLILLIGFLTAVLLHTIYNSLIIRTDERLRFIFLIFFLFSLSLFLSYCIKKAKAMKSICKN